MKGMDMNNVETVSPLAEDPAVQAQAGLHGALIGQRVVAAGHHRADVAAVVASDHTTVSVRRDVLAGAVANLTTAEAAWHQAGEQTHQRRPLSSQTAASPAATSHTHVGMVCCVP